VDAPRLDPGRRFFAGLLEALVEVMGTAQGYLFQHGPRVALLAQDLADELGVEERLRAELFFAAVLSDVGMIGLVEDAWEDPVEVLPPRSRARVIRHPERSASTVREIPYMRGLEPLVRHHHEWWDGSGYPDGLSGLDIPIGARILRLADTVCALAEPRPHRPALPPDAVHQAVVESAGVEFSPDVVHAFLSLEREGRLREFQPGRFHRACLDAAAALVPAEVSPLSTREFLDIIGALIDAKDAYTAGHSRRVARLGAAVADQLTLGAELERTAFAAGYLHDLGKVSVPVALLTREGPLDEAEHRAVRSHAETGARILERIPSLRHLAPGCRYHHERWDGSGYPEGLSGDRIPLLGQVLAVCDAYDAMTSGRAYRRGCSHPEAVEELRRARGTQFSPAIVEAFTGLPSSVFRSLWSPEETLPRFFGPVADPRRRARTALD